MDGQMTFEFAQRPTIKGFPELRWTGKRPYRSTQYFPAQLRERYGEEKDGWINKIFWGDNLQVMSHMLKEYRGKIDLIYIDPPFDSKADYKKKIEVKGIGKAETDSTSFEEKQYGDIWSNDEYLQFMYERLIILRELLSDHGCIYLHCDWHKSHHLRMIMDEVFGNNKFVNEVIWHYSGAGTPKYASVMYEKDTIARDSSLKEKNIDYIRDQMKFSAFSLAGELARYLNISCILTSRILRESVDGIDAILEAVNKYNEILNDVIVPGVFHALYEVKSELHTEDKELVLLKEPKDAGYYEFSAKDELVITNQYKALTQEQIAKSFHADTYCFDSKPEKECFLQYITNSKIKEVYFTGMFTANQGDLSVQYYDPESGRIRHYYPDFLAKLEDGSYQLIEVKGDNKIDDTVVKAKAAAAQEMAVASGIEYKMYAGSEIMTTHILAYLDGMASTISYADHMQQGTLSMVAETSAPYGSDK